jgi:hypothetical protein
MQIAKTYSFILIQILNSGFYIKVLNFKNKSVNIKIIFVHFFYIFEKNSVAIVGVNIIFILYTCTNFINFFLKGNFINF